MALDLDNFQLLLNNLSIELGEGNLRSLIHICGQFIPGGQRDNIRNGWDVFATLRHENAIGDSPEKLKFLLKIMRELRPRRRDLVSMVKMYIEQNYPQEAKSILNDVVESNRVESSGEFSFPSSQPPWTPILVDDPHPCCVFRTGCFNCGCTRCCCNCCCCCVILMIFFLLLTVASVLVWYTNIFPEVKDSKTPKYVGPLVTFVFGFLAVSFFSLSVGYHCFQRHCGAASHTYLLVDDRMNSQAVRDSSYAPSVGTQTSSEAFPREMHHSASSSRMTASSSVASITN